VRETVLGAGDGFRSPCEVVISLDDLRDLPVEPPPPPPLVDPFLVDPFREAKEVAREALREAPPSKEKDPPSLAELRSRISLDGDRVFSLGWS